MRLLQCSILIHPSALAPFWWWEHIIICKPLDLIKMIEEKWLQAFKLGLIIVREVTARKKSQEWTNINNGWALFTGTSASEPAHLNGMQPLRKEMSYTCFLQVKACAVRKACCLWAKSRHGENKWTCEWRQSAGQQPLAVWHLLLL